MRRGIVLFLVMIVIVILSLAGLSFVITMSTENKAVHVAGDQMQIEQVLASGVEALKAFAALSREERERAGGGVDNRELFRAALVIDDELGHRARFSLISPQIDEDQISGIRFGLQNESARLNLAVLPEWEKAQPGAARNALMGLPGMTDAIAAAILDWIDEDDVSRPDGAEAEYYAGVGVPYRPRNGVPTSLEELLLIRGVSRELLFGSDIDFNYHVEDAELRLASGGAGLNVGPSALRWASLVTVYSAERNTSYEGRPRIHLNEKDLRKLYKQLSEVFDPAWARFIVAYRQFGPYDEIAEQLAPATPGETAGPLPAAASQGRSGRRGRRAGPGPLPEAEAAVAVRPGRQGEGVDLNQPARFDIASVLDLVGVKVRLCEPDAPEPARRSAVVQESPFSPDRYAMEDYLPKLVDATTVVADPVIRGRINVNEAPRAVLLGLPGLDRSIVDRIVSARGVRLAADDPGRRQPTWLLTEGLVDLGQMKELMPFVTTGGDVFRAQVAAFFDDSGPMARAEVVVDGTASPPRQVYWKDMRLLGGGFSRETLGAEPLTDTALGAGLPTQPPLGAGLSTPLTGGP